MPTLPPDEPEPTLETLPARIEAAEKEAESKRTEGEAFIAAQMEQLNQTLAALGLPKQEPAERKLTGPPRFSASGKRRELEEIALLLESQDQDASILRNQLGDAAAMESWDKAEETMRDGYRLGAAANAALRA